MAGARVLVVDDEMHIRQILRLHLEVAGLQVLEAGSGGEALAVVRNGCPNLIVLDLGLPDMSGLALCEQLQADPHTCGIPVIVLTALGDEDSACPGTIAVITKPFSARDVLDLIASALGREAA
jgi:two-component system OmpR family response regulator